MSLTTHVAEDGRWTTIKISGRFDFSVHQEFRQAYEQARPDGKFTLDLKQTEYMDSSALGMLLLLREHAGGDAADISLMHCSPTIHKILMTANFDKLFHIR